MNNNYSACTSILVGRKATTDGSTLIGRNEDAKSAWPKRFIVHEHQKLAKQQKFISKDNNFQILLPKERLKYTATPEWTDKFGLFEEDGINEDGVAMSATESTYANNQVLGADSLVKNGIGEEAMLTVVLPYIKTAKEGVKRLGKIVSEYGASETNGILFSDCKEVWYFEIGSGHNWVAEKIPDDEYAVVANQMAIQNINFDDPINFQWSPNILEFVNQNKLNINRKGFNFREIFGTQDQSDTYYNTPRVWYGQRTFNPKIEQNPNSQQLPFSQKAEHLISVFDAQSFLSSHYQGTVFDPLGTGTKTEKTKFRPISLAKTQESHVLQLNGNLPQQIGDIHWLLMGVGAQSTYVPFFAGITDTPEEYQYPVGKDYDPKSAYWIYKLVGVLVDPHYLEFGEQLSNVQNQLVQSYIQIINETIQASDNLTGKELNKLADKQSNKAAIMAMDSFKKLASQFITQSTDFSPLNYHQDLNL
ncbi:C69 family dipeptidase [Fructilactobacillus lindneri]|uniref:Dipeptidase n=1 Tax=Fructilactobacillus lindneri TaxID=53444 RepID=A0AB33BN31_9LACO|nr:C69 family dipeptidase [Fructilactobacillus lindneri]ANZ58201.1 peptidase U34 [Fructilactobacillus lindneri]ANZ59522.1 peptidase U34 [Fructilactobacillus lindneri]POG98694.1 peptidase U34 [Fructilactobacillus lindneri]POH04082.1 peptidase U34 [Fructilactobacillus lindneri]POH04676.1 peptidase U34 [Fructilactobacillus lindneri]